MPQFNVKEQLEKDAIVEVTLEDGTECRSVIVTPSVRRDLRKIDRDLAEKTEALRRTQRLQEKANDGEALTDSDFEQLRAGLDVVDDIEDATYDKLVILLETDDGGRPSVEQVRSMGDKLANRLYRLITEDAEGNDSQPETPSPAETTTTS